MHIHINNVNCHNSNWNNESYDAICTVAVSRITNGNLFNDPLDKDWLNLIEEYELPREDGLCKFYHCHRLKLEVLDWLITNIKDYKGNPGWCTYSPEWTDRIPLNHLIFFARRSDSYRFIRTWSIHKKPTSVFNYFTYTTKVLDSNGKLRKIET